MKLTPWQDFWVVVFICVVAILIGINVSHILGLVLAFGGIAGWDKATTHFDLVEETEMLR